MILTLPLKITAIGQGECVKCQNPKKEEVVKVEMERSEETLHAFLCYRHLTKWVATIGRIERCNKLRAMTNQHTGFSLAPLDVMSEARDALQRENEKAKRGKRSRNKGDQDA